MDWSTIKPRLIEVFTALALDRTLPNEPEFTAQWRDRGRLATHDGQRVDVYLKVLSVKNLAPAEIRRRDIETEPGVTALEVTAVTHQRMVLRVEAHAIDDTDDISAMHVTSRIAARIDLPGFVDALQAVQLSVTAVGPELDTTYVADGRAKPRATIDITMLGVAVETDPIPQGWIERIELTSHLRGEDGAELPVPPNVVNETLPPFED